MLNDVNPCLNRLPCLFAQLELHGTTRLALEDAWPGQDVVTVGNILHAQANQIASAQLAIDGQVAEGKVTQPLAELQPDADRPDFLRLQRWRLSDQPAVVQGTSPLDSACSVFVFDVDIVCSLRGF